MVYLIIAGIFLVTLSSLLPVIQIDIWYTQYLTLFAYFLLILSVLLWKFNKFISVFTILCLLSILFVTKQEPRSLLYIIQIYLSCFAMVGLGYLKAENRIKILKAICFVALIQGLWTVLQYFNLDPLFNASNDPTKDDTVGFLGSKNQLGVFMSVTSPVVTHFFPWMLPFSIFALWCTKTTTAWVAFIIGLSFLILTKYTKYVKYFLIIGLLASLIFWGKFDNNFRESFAERASIYKFSITSVLNGRVDLKAVFKDEQNNLKEFNTTKTCNPLFGFGLASFGRMSPYFAQNTTTITANQNGGRYYEHAHNDYVEVFFEMGITGIICITLLILHFFLQYFRAKKTPLLNVLFACILTQLVCSLGVYTVQTAPSGLLLILFYGLFQAEIKSRTDRKV